MSKPAQKIAVLGGGMVGMQIARDLKCSGYEVVVFDLRPERAEVAENYGLAFSVLDVCDEDALTQAIERFDLVVGAVPSRFGYKMLKTVISAGKNCVDISFTLENVRQLDSLAKEKGVTVITDMGVAPGMFGLLVGKALAEYESVESAILYIGGIPEQPREPWKHINTFCVADVLEEYTRPVRMREKGSVVEKNVLEEILPVTVQGHELEAFDTDGCRSLLEVPVDFVTERTLRYPGHLHMIEELRKNGDLAAEKILKTAEKLAGEWSWREEDRDLLVFRLEIRGKKNGKVYEDVWETVDKYDTVKGVTAMARTTGYTCTAAATMVAKGLFSLPGVHMPEDIGRAPSLVSHILSHLEQRGVHYKRTTEAK